MMKTLFIALFAFINISVNVTTETVEATYDGFEEETYYFSDEDEITHSFDSVSKEAASQYDLMDATYKGKKFKITYVTTTEVNEDDEEYDAHHITELEMLD